MLVSLWRVANGSSVLRSLWPGRWERQVLECGGNCPFVQLSRGSLGMSTKRSVNLAVRVDLRECEH